MGTPEFPDLGKHCSVDSCSLIDFLPFKCDKCEKILCLDHRSYASHACLKAAKGEVTCIICPLCAKAIRISAEEEPNSAWNRHSATSGCDPSNYAKVTKKKKCPVKNCKEVLSFSNTIKCRDCEQETCLKHRFGPDHLCTGGQKKKNSATSSSIFGERFLQNFQRSTGLTAPTQNASSPKAGPARVELREKPKIATTSRSSSAAAAAAAAAAASRRAGAGASAQLKGNRDEPANTVRGSAHRRQTDWERTRLEALSAVARGTPSSTTATATGTETGRVTATATATGSATGSASREREEEVRAARSRGEGSSEQCPQCSAQFRDVPELIMHVDNMHLGGPGGGPREGFGLTGVGERGEGREMCPRCGRAFADVVTLVAHAEAEHGADKSICTVS